MTRHRPQRYLGVDHGDPTSQEHRVAGKIHGKRVGGSGASQFSKGDVRDVPSSKGITFLVECKQTIHASISVKWNWLKKITGEADDQQCEPALSIEIQGGGDDARTDRDWVLIPLRVFNKLKGDL